MAEKDLLRKVHEYNKRARLKKIDKEQMLKDHRQRKPERSKFFELQERMDARRKGRRHAREEIAKVKRQSKTIDVRAVQNQLTDDIRREERTPPRRALPKPTATSEQFYNRNSDEKPKRLELPARRRKKKNNPERVAMALKGR